MKRAIILLAIAACGDSGALDFKPVFEGPIVTDDAYAWNVIAELDLSVANAGEATDIVSNRFSPDQDVSLVGVPFADHLVMHATGTDGDRPVAYGRTCEFTLAASDPAPSPHLFFSNSARFATTNVEPIARTNGVAVEFLGSAVLMSGGTDQPELFDPSAGALLGKPEDGKPGIGAMRQGRSDLVAALLGSTRPQILTVGGTDSGEPVSYYELYDPRVQQSNHVYADAHFARIGLTATTLSDGRVIVIGGNEPGMPAVGNITDVSLGSVDPDILQKRALVHPRSLHTATVLGDDVGSPVLIAGGVDNATSGTTIGTIGGAVIAEAELYKPLMGTLVTFDGVMKHPRKRHHAVRVRDGSILFIGGVDATGQPVRTLERFTIEEGFTDVVDAAGDPVTFDADVGMVDNTVTLLADGRVLVAGGRPDLDAQTGPTNTAVILRLAVESGSIDIVPTDKLAVPRSGHTAALLCDGTVFISGGTSVPTAERYNPDFNGRR